MTVALIASCESQLEDPAVTPPASVSTPDGGSDIIGSVNGENIYRYEYDYYFNTMFDRYFNEYYDTMLQYQGVDLLDEESAREFLGTLEDYAWHSAIQASIIRQMAAKDYGISMESSYYDKLLSPATALAISTSRLYGELQPIIEDETRAAKEVSEADAKEYYDTDPAAWDCRKVAHIIITAQKFIEDAEADGKEMTEEEAEEAAIARANAIIDRLNKGEAFADLASEFGEDGTAEIGGEMDLYFNASGAGVSDNQGGFDPDFSAGAFDLEKVGDFSKEPVKSSFGYHIIKLLDKKEGFEAVKSFVLESLQFVDSNEVGEYFQNKMMQVEEEATIVRNIEYIYYVEPPEDDDVDDDIQ
jgi:rubrerythrin